MKNLKEFIRKLDCRGRLADLAMTGRRESSDNLFNLSPYRPIALSPSKAFTMAEILLSLTIIGIVAAITLPSLTANFQDKAFNTKRQALHARLSQAFRMMDYTEYIPLLGRTSDEWEDGDNYDKAIAKNFLEDLGKYLSIKAISDPEMIFGPKEIDDSTSHDWYRAIGEYSPFSGGPRAYFQTTNGESVGILFYLFHNIPETSDKKYPVKSMLFVLVYDVNGAKGPNKFGKDAGIMGAFYYDNIELYAPMLGAVTNNMIDENCDPNDSSCQKYRYPDYRLPTPEELLVLFAITEMHVEDWDINLGTPICSIDGHKYSIDSLINNADSPELDGDADSCTYLLITNDGSAPKNGIIYDINSGDDGE